MKKIYATPEVILRRINMEGIMDKVSVPIPGGEGTFEGADSRENNWDDEEESDNIWED